jgi:molybdenum cofactor biosynthesis enzyme MoaA
MLKKWHAIQLFAVGEPLQRPERVPDLRSLSRGRFDELDERCRLGTNQKEIGLIGPVSHHPSCNCLRLSSEARWLTPSLLKVGERDSEIPLRTGCDTAALNIFMQMAAGARMDRCVPDSLFEQRAKCGKSRIGG